MPTLPIEKLDGGLSLLDRKAIKDNQFVRLKNWFYNKDKRLQTRYGIAQYFSNVPDSVVLINACDATTNFVATDDAVTIAAGAAIRGSASVSFGITVATTGNDFATVTNAVLSADISTAKGYFGFWFKVPAEFNTNLTAVKVRLGSDASNYYEWTLPALIEATSLFIKLNYSDAVVTGTPVDTAITYFRLQTIYAGTYTDKAGILIDDMRSYSSTSNKPVTSYFFFQRDDNQLRTAICVCGTNIFRWDETATSWELINSGITEFETAIGMTTFRTRWDFCVYKNNIYMCNGVDSYRMWNGTTMTTYAGQPKVRFLRYMKDRVFGFGDDSNPSTLYYTAALPGDASTINANLVVVGGDELGKGTALFELGSFPLAFKSKKIYVINISGSGSVDPIDTQNGGYSNRCIANVGNALLYYNDQGIDNLKQKAAATGAEALESTPYTDDLRTLIQQIAPAQYNANCGFYGKQINNYYFSFDTGDDNIPETTLVLSALVRKAWTQYTYPAIYEYGFYIDSNGRYHYLICSANTGAIYEIETGFLDLGNPIEYDLLTKAWNFGDESTWKDYHFLDIFGLKSEGGSFTIEIIVDDEIIYTSTLTDSFLTSTSAGVTIASNPIADAPLGGGESIVGDIELFPYFIRLGGVQMGSGQTIQVRMYNDATEPVVLTVDRMLLGYDNNTVDLFPFDNLS